MTHRTRIPAATLASALLLSTMMGVGLLAVVWPAAPARASEPPAEETPAPAPGEEGPLVAEGPQADLALIYTGGVVGYVEPCG